MIDDEALLERYHARPGRTVAMLAGFRDARGRTSYEVMIDALRDVPRDARVLDLGCGDGELLAQLAARGFSRLCGIDRSPHEIAAARERLGSAISLARCAADALPFVDGTIDVVACHLALIVMAPIDAVIAAIARVLRPGGRLIAVINRHHPDPAFAAFSHELARATQAAGLPPLPG